MKKYDVVIVGLGPTGGTLANLLALNGFSILILEREKSLYSLPRAVHFDDEVMRVFQTIGITNDFLKHTIINKGTKFVNSKGEPATATDLFGMYIGELEINPLYVHSEELTPDFIRKYFETTSKAFDQVARENVMSKKEAWKALCDTEAMQAVTEKELMDLALDTLRGENYPTPDQVRYAMGKYKECPMCLALIFLAGHRLPELEEIHEKLKELATA